MKKLKAGLFGLGVVGSGVYKFLTEHPDFGITVDKIAVKNIAKQREVEIDDKILTSKSYDLLEDTDLDLIIELINDPDEAFKIVKKAFENGKSVVSANKKMVALYHRKLLELQRQHQVKFFYEAAVCGSIPILRLLDQHFKSDEVQSIKAIANGTCNFILSKMVDEDESYDKALSNAQELGFAELDPYSDVSGQDTAFKLSILIYHAFGQFVHPNKIELQGINNLDKTIIEYAQKHNLKIKLIGEATYTNQQLSAKVEPQLVYQKEDFHLIENEYNGILIDAKYMGQQFVKGKGAGSYPTAMAVVSNLKDVLYDLAIPKPDLLNNSSTSSEATQELYFIAGYDNRANLNDLDIKEEGIEYIIVKAKFDTLNNLKQKEPKLYWVKISPEIYANIQILEVTI